jgi:hypothetical protein
LLAGSASARASQFRVGFGLTSAELASHSAALLARYPRVPVAFPEGAHTAHSSHLHLIVNGLEVEAAQQFLGRAKAVEIAEKNFVYSGLYRILLADWTALAELYRPNALTPIQAATGMTADDLAIAALMDEATTG